MLPSTISSFNLNFVCFKIPIISSVGLFLHQKVDPTPFVCIEQPYQQPCASSCPVILTHVALKWLHSFFPSVDCNPLNSDFCRNNIEFAKRQKSQPIMKKKPITTEVTRNIRQHTAELTNLLQTENWHLGARKYMQV